jgi:hypothetical protein
MKRYSLVATLTTLVLAVTCAAEDAKEKDYKDVPLEQLGVQPVTPAKDASAGFFVGGKNATALIRKLTEINGRTIADLEKDMRPGARADKPMGPGLERFEGSTKGFLGADEKLLDVLAMDNEFVVDKLGLTHQDLARPLLVAAALGSKNRFDEKGVAFRYYGQDYRIRIVYFKGFQFSPFYDRTSTSRDAELENLTANKKLNYSLLVPLMIERYGYYEGKGTPYRVAPAAIVEMFPHLTVGKE